MFSKILLLFALVAEWKTSCSAPVPTRMVDLTHVFDNTTLNWPDARKFEVEHVLIEVPGFRMKIEEFSSSTHSGTHMDAPCHFVENRQSIDEIPLENLVAPAAVVDIREKVALDRDYELQKEDLLQWENKTGHFFNEVILLVRSGWSKRWSNRTAYIGHSNNSTEDMHFPGISASAAKWLVNNRNVYGVGVETLSLDHGPSKDFEAHKILNGNNIYGLENVDSLEDLPIFGATLHVMPMKIGGACGAPCRIVATFPDVIYGSEDTKTTKSATEEIFHEVIKFA